MQNDGGHEAGRQIPGGYVMVARETQDSPLWGWPPAYQRLWLYLLMEARWDERPGMDRGVTIHRGQVLRSYREVVRDCAWTENNARRQWKPGQVGHMLERMERAGMLSKELVTGEHVTGPMTLITLQAFNDYQDPERYRNEACDGARERLRQACDTLPVTPSPAQGTSDQGDSSEPAPGLVTPLKAEAGDGIEKERKNPTPPGVLILEKRERYTPDQRSTIDHAFDSFRSTRKTKRMADSVVLREYDYWEQYPVEQVIRGLKIYIEGGYASEGKDEKYARGIIRNHSEQSIPQANAHPYRRLRKAVRR